MLLVGSEDKLVVVRTQLQLFTNVIFPQIHAETFKPAFSRNLLVLMAFIRRENIKADAYNGGEKQTNASWVYMHTNSKPIELESPNGYSFEELERF